MNNNFFDRSYYYGKRKSNYQDYSATKYIFYTYAKILYRVFRPTCAFDAGGAFGYLVDSLRRRGVEARGIDISEFAVKHSPYMRKGDITNLEETRAFDLVICTDVLEHIEEGFLEQTLQGLWQITGKYLVVTVAIKRHSIRDLDPTHVTMKPVEWWEDLFTRLGYPRSADKEWMLRANSFCRKMNWSNRLFVLERSNC